MVLTVYLVVTVTVNRRRLPSDLSRWRGSVDPLLELKDRHLQLTPG